MSPADLDAVVLAGGRGRRLGGRDKAVIALGGERLVDRAVASARAAGAGRIVVVGPAHTGSEGVLVVREDPPFAGPLAALVAALPRLRAEWVLLLSCDLVRPDAVCALLAAQLSRAGDVDGVVLRDEGGRDQWLSGVYRLGALRAAEPGIRADPANAPLRALLGGLRLRRVDAPDETTADIDEPADLERAVVAGGFDSAPLRSTSGGRSESEPMAAGNGDRWLSERSGVETRRPDGPRRSADPEHPANPRTKEPLMSTPKHLPPEALDQWLAAAAAELDLDPSAVSIGAVLDVARDVAHDVARPAAPLSTFLLGVAVGRSEDPEALQALAARITARAAEWKAAASDPDPAG